VGNTLIACLACWIPEAQNKFCAYVGSAQQVRLTLARPAERTGATTGRTTGAKSRDTRHKPDQVVSLSQGRGSNTSARERG
jgi:hypothetical protein